jgi:hypothetical protein
MEERRIAFRRYRRASTAKRSSASASRRAEIQEEQYNNRGQPLSFCGRMR